MFKQWVTVNTGLQILFLRFRTTCLKGISLNRTTKQREGFVAEFVTFNKGTKVLAEIPIEVIRESVVVLTSLTEYAPVMTIAVCVEGGDYEVIMQKLRGDSVVTVTFGETSTPIPGYDREDVPHLHGDLLFQL